MVKDDCTGVILAGGKSSRFGSNKALAELDGRPLIQYPGKVLESLFRQNLLVTNTPDDYGFLNWPTVPDLYPGAGPLAGIHAALCATDTPFVFVTGCDMPFLDRELINYLYSLIDDHDAVVPHTAKGLEPLHAFYNRKIFASVTANLERGALKVHKLLSSLNLRVVEENEIINFSATGLDSFRNINIPGELPANG